MYQCIPNVPLWNDWSKLHGSPVLKAVLLQSFQWISATRISYSFGKIQNAGETELSEEKN